MSVAAPACPLPGIEEQIPSGASPERLRWYEGRLLAFDLETTSPDPEKARIVTSAMVLAGGGQPTLTRHWLVNPGVEIPATAEAIHGVSTAYARANGEAPASAIARMIALLAGHMRQGVPAVIFNARYDLTVLDREARRHGLATLSEQVGGTERLLVIDPLVLDKKAYRWRKGQRTLSAMCEYYEAAHAHAHEAIADALAAARLAYRIGHRYEWIGRMSARTLHKRQCDWAADQATSLAEHFDKQNTEHDVVAAWPVIPFLGG